MKKKLLTVLSMLGMVTCVTMVPVSVKGMRREDSPMPSSFPEKRAIIEKRCHDPLYIGKAFHDAICHIDILTSVAKLLNSDMEKEVVKYYKSEEDLYTFLHKCENPETVWLMRDFGLSAILDCSDKQRRSPLMYARNKAVAQALIDCGANINHTDKDCLTPLMYTDRPDVAQVLIDNGANIDDLRQNERMEREDIAKLLIDNADKVSRTDSED